MRLFLPSPEIGDTEGFTPDKDIFGRAEQGRRLTSLISSIDDPLVIAVDAPWGSGKTTFLRMWAGELRKAHFPVIYFDAYENDYADDAFAALASQIILLAKDLQKANTPQVKTFARTALKAGKILVRSSLKVATKAATMGALDASDLSNFAAEIAGEAATLEDKYIGELLTSQNEQRESIAAFREALAALPPFLTPQSDQTNSKPVIFFMDDLDRCRPIFALELLERVKHFFAVPKVHFILGTHIGQLQNSVQVAYGPNIDAATYLQKFIHLVFLLMDRERYAHERTIPKFLDYLTLKMEFPEDQLETVKYATRIIRHTAERQTLSLRAIERVMSMLAIAIAFSPKNSLRVPPVLAGLCILKALKPQLYAGAKKGTLSYSEAHGALSLGEPPLEGEESQMEYAQSWWRFGTGDKMDEKDVKELYGAIARYNIRDRKDLVPIIANDILDRMIANPTNE
jgi:hypothetical protein